MRVLPAGWHTETLSEVARGGLFSDGDWVESKDQDPAGGVRLTQLADVGVADFRDRSDRRLREDQASRLGCTFLQPDDILVARMPDPLGRACLVPPNIGRAVTVVDVAILRPARADVDRRYVMWALNSPQASAQAESMQSGTTRKRISRKNLGTVTIPVPELAEQRRIVEILEDHLSRLDAATQGLTDAAGRAARLVAASSASQLATVGVDWEISTVGARASLIEYGSSTKTTATVRPGRVPVLRMGNIKDGCIDWTSLKYLDADHHEFPRLLLQRGDLLFNRTNSAEHVGKSAVFDGDGVASFASYLIRVRLDGTVLSEWANLAINSPQGRHFVASVVSQQVGQANMNGTKLRSFPLPVPPITEQEARVRAHNTVVESRSALVLELQRARRRSERLRQALLAAAFSGRLTGRASDLDLAEEMAST